MHPLLWAYRSAGLETDEQVLEFARCRGIPAWRDAVAAIQESAGNITRLLGFNQKIAARIHAVFGPLDFTAAKLMASVGEYDDGMISITLPDDFKREMDDEDARLAVDIAVYAILDEVNLTGERGLEPGETNGAAEKLKTWLKNNLKFVPRINSAPVGSACFDVIRQAILTKKKPIDQFKVIVPLGGGWNWIDLGSGCDDVESAEMQHCGTDGRGNLVSLRDPQNNAHITMTYDSAENMVYQIKGKQNDLPVRKYWPAVWSFFRKTNAILNDYDLEKNDSPEARDLLDLLKEYDFRTRYGKLDYTVESVGREHSTAMVIVPGEIPGKNLCQMIRGLIGDRSRLIVVAQPGNLPPGSFERLLRASMPDVEKKLRVMDGGKSVADAVSSAERNRHYSPSQALEVFAPADLVQTFTQEVRGGRLGFDPTVIQATPIEVPSDDSEAIRSAVTSNDTDAMHRVLDPHLFSDQGSLQAFKDAMRGQAQESLREFLTDIAPSRELGIAKLDSLLRAELGSEFADLEYLGSGRNGSAYRTPDGLILKVTTDPAEVESSIRLQGESCEYLHEVYEVYPLAEHVWLILQEGLDHLPSQYAEEFDLAMEILETIGAGHALRAGDAEGIREVMMNCGRPDLCVLVAEVMKKFGVGGMLREVSELGLSADFHSGNIMLREGRPVLTDLGTPGDDPNEVKKGPRRVGRQVSELAGAQAAPQAGPPSQMRGSNSSAWAGGRMVISKPEQHVPEDENETERDGALDQDIVGGGLDWGAGLSKRGY